MKLKTMTSSPEGFLVTSTLVYGEKEAVLIDAQFTLADARNVAAAIRESGRKLASVFVTHFHPDHYFGLVEIRKAFPEAKFLATPSTIKQIRQTMKGKVEQWKPVYGDAITSEPLVPEPLKGSKIMLEGEGLQVFSGVQGDCAGSSFVWIPSLKAVVCGDTVYSGVYPWTLETTPAERKDWIKTLDKIASLKPSMVVAGHKAPAMKDDLSGLEFTKRYLVYYDEALPSSKSAEEFRSKINAKFPGLSLDIILKLASDAAFAKK
jgi:glyoxylase-like metal-dependent hydrolase (beta-lactamase superfamily II)